MTYPDLPLNSEQDVLILMHRDVHFGGNFEIMIEYYEQGGKGVRPEFELSQIQTLHRLELEMEEDLAPKMLSGAEAERVRDAKNAYKTLRDLYEKPEMQDTYALLIADLILSEEMDPKEEIAALVERQSVSVPFLIDLVKSEDFYDPLFPGYGFAPELAARCLGEIGDNRAVTALFESIREGDFFEEETCLKALKNIGIPAKEFLLRVLQHRPLGKDNERAAIALISFKDEEEVAERCLSMLEEPEVREHPSLASYLALACEGLQKSQSRERFRAIAESPGIPRELRDEILTVSREFPSS